MTKATFWTPEEHALLDAHYPNMGSVKMQQAGMLLRFTRRAIRECAKRRNKVYRRPLEIVVELPKARWWDYPVLVLGVSPRAVLA